MKLEKKIAIVTGGAQGIGKAIVKVMCDEGAHVVIADIDEKAGWQAEKEIPKTEFCKLDLRNDFTFLVNAELVAIWS